MNDTLKIDIGIPIPPRKERKGTYKEIIKKMKVGDSVLLETKNKASAFLITAKRVGKKAISREVEEDGVHGFRVWLVAK